MTCMEPSFRDVKELKHTDLRALIQKEIRAVRIKNYFKPCESASMAALLEASPLKGEYINARGIERVGQSFFECQTSEEAAELYKRESANWIKQLRSGSAPLLTPVDRIRLELDEIWPAGANLATKDGAKMFVGLAREFKAGSEAEPHQDVLSWDDPRSDFAREVKTQLAANTYLRVPEQGGELTLWPTSYTAEEYERLRIPGSYGLDRQRLPNGCTSITPRVGDLILFNANCVHAVEKIIRGTRVTWSCFVGYRGDAEPLVLWS